MGLREFVSNIVDRFKGNQPDPTDTLVAPGISADYYTQFVEECRHGVAEIQDIKEWLLSRKLRDKVDELCDAANGLISSCQTHPARVSEVRELPSILKRVPRTLHEHTVLHVGGNTHDRQLLTETTETMDALIQGFEGMSEDMLLGSRINLEALNETLGRIAARRTNTFPSLEELH